MKVMLFLFIFFILIFTCCLIISRKYELHLTSDWIMFWSFIGTSFWYIIFFKAAQAKRSTLRYSVFFLQLGLSVELVKFCSLKMGRPFGLVNP